MIWMLLLSAALGSPDCSTLCGTAATYQGYGSDAEDPVCQAYCQGVGEACERQWEAWFDCIQLPGSPDCRLEWEAARVCSLCGGGDLDLLSDGGVFVAMPQDPAECTGTESGAVEDPFCDLDQLIADTVALRDAKGIDVTTLVCPGDYRAGADLDATHTSTNQPGQVRIEAVVSGTARFLASRDRSEEATTVEVERIETVTNLLYDTAQLDSAWWSPVGLTIAELPSAAASNGPVPGASAWTLTKGSSGADSLQQNLSSAVSDHNLTFSLYVRPVGVTAVRLDFVQSGHDAGQGPSQRVELPAVAGPQGSADTEGDGWGIEDLGLGWYRVWHTASFHDQTHATVARLYPEGPAGSTLDVFAPQLDARPLDQRRTTARPYIGDSVPVSMELSEVVELVELPWTLPWGMAGLQQWPELEGRIDPLFRRAEQVFVDGAPLQQQLSIHDLDPGSFFVDDAFDYAAHTYRYDLTDLPGSCDVQPCSLWLALPQGVALEDALIEVSEHARLAYFAAVHDLHVSGLVFAHASGTDGTPSANGLQSPALAFVNSQDLTLTEVVVAWNSSSGIAVVGSDGSDSNVRLQDCEASHNGVIGQGVGLAGGFHIVGQRLIGNNWRGARVGFVGSITGGAKYGNNVGGSFESGLVEDNFGHGLWLDYANQAVSIYGSTFVGNSEAGVFLERNDTGERPPTAPISVGANTFVGNGVGLSAVTTSRVVVEANTFTDNGVALLISGTPDSLLSTPEGVPLQAYDWTVNLNDMTLVADDQRWFEFGAADGNPAWLAFEATLSTAANTYDHTQQAPGGFEGFRVNSDWITLDAWTTCASASPVPEWCDGGQDPSP